MTSSGATGPAPGRPPVDPGGPVVRPRIVGPIAVILGSAFPAEDADGLRLRAHHIDTAFGGVTLHEVEGLGRPAWALFRHGRPHRWLPHQIPWRAHAAALAAIGCESLLITSSVGVLVPDVPLFRPLLVRDLLMPDNRLPDGSPCTMWPEPAPGQGHLVWSEGPFSGSFSAEVTRLAADVGEPVAGEVTFAYVAGPRTKTRAENRLWASLGADVNSMTVGPEVVLANELGIPCAALVVGHKTSRDSGDGGAEPLEDSLTRSRAAMVGIVRAVLGRAVPAPFGNHLFRFER